MNLECALCFLWNQHSLVLQGFCENLWTCWSQMWQIAMVQHPPLLGKLDVLLLVLYILQEWPVGSRWRHGDVSRWPNNCLGQTPGRWQATVARGTCLTEAQQEREFLEQHSSQNERGASVQLWCWAGTRKVLWPRVEHLQRALLFSGIATPRIWALWTAPRLSLQVQQGSCWAQKNSPSSGVSITVLGSNQPGFGGWPCTWAWIRGEAKVQLWHWVVFHDPCGFCYALQ